MKFFLNDRLQASPNGARLTNFRAGRIISATLRSGRRPNQPAEPGKVVSESDVVLLNRTTKRNASTSLVEVFFRPIECSVKAARLFAILSYGGYVLTNNNFMLSDAQIAAYNSWAEEQASHAWAADAAESHEIEVRFTFTPFGRVVEAIVGGSEKKLVLEDCYE